MLACTGGSLLLHARVHVSRNGVVHRRSGFSFWDHLMDAGWRYAGVGDRPLLLHPAETETQVQTLYAILHA